MHSEKNDAVPILICSLKSFGDFVISLSAIKSVQPHLKNPPPIILAGRHLEALAVALGASVHIQFISNGTETDVPSAFDIRKRGKVAAIRSLLHLRHELSVLDRDRYLVFDRIGWRERFISSGHSLIELPRDSNNIYLDYDRKLVDLGYAVAVNNVVSTQLVRQAVIVPGSRLTHKVIPLEVIASIDAELRERGFQVTVITLSDETVAVPPSVHSIVLPRRFDALAAAVKATDMVISADSLSAHLGEYYGLPTFVVNFAPNLYWLPRSAYLSNGWATFDDLRPLLAWLNGYSDAL